MKSIRKLLTVTTLLGFGVTSVLSTVISTPYKRDVEGMEWDLMAVNVNLSSFDTALHYWIEQGQSSTQGLTLHGIATVAIGAINNTISKANNSGSLTFTNATYIQQSVATIQPLLIDICKTVGNASNSTTGTPFTSINPGGPIITETTPPRPSASGEPITSVHLVKRQSGELSSSIELLKNDVLVCNTVYNQLLGILKDAAPTNTSAQFEQLQTEFRAACQISSA